MSMYKVKIKIEVKSNATSCHIPSITFFPGFTTETSMIIRYV